MEMLIKCNQRKYLKLEYIIICIIATNDYLNIFIQVLHYI